MNKFMLLLIGVLFLSVSCVKDIDLSQAQSNDYTFTTPMSFALLKINLNQDDFIENTNEITYKNLYLTGLGGILNESKKDSLTLTTSFSHSFDRNVYCHFSYRDKNNESLPISDGFLIEKGDTQPHIVTYEGDKYEAFARANWIYVSIRTLSNTSPPPTLNGNFNLQTVLGFSLEVPKSK